MIKELIKLANELDRNGHRDLASKLDFILIENKDEINKLAIAVEIPAEEAMAHEEHSPFEESPEYESAMHSEEFRKIEMAERVAELVVGGTDPETGALFKAVNPVITLNSITNDIIVSIKQMKNAPDTFSKFS